MIELDLEAIQTLDVEPEAGGVPGASAYDIYVRNGGTLTEIEWLESLKGQNGITPSITIGNTQTLEAGSQATVQKTGTTLNPVFSFGIPQGIQGEQGEQGIQGEKGDKGDKGDTGTSVLDFRVVQTLPTQEISTTTIYLLRNTETIGSNLYDEWVYVNNNWEKIGDTRVDLSDYYNKTEVDNKLTDKQDNLTAGTNIEITSGNVINNTIPFSSNKYNGGLNLGTTNPTMSSDSVSVGYASSATNTQSVVLGAYVNNSKYSTIAIGSRAQPNYNYSMVFGYQATATKTNQAVFGSTSANINEAAIYTSSGLKNLATEDYVDNAISTAIGDVLGGSY